MRHPFRFFCVSTLISVAAVVSTVHAATDTTPVVVDAKTLTTSATGLHYKDLKTGTGASATAGTKVTVHYTGWLQNTDGSIGKKFDSSRDANQPFSFVLGAGNVIKGWDEGVQGMRVGGQRRLVIPAVLGYGQRGAGGVIPPGATLIFDVELLSL